MARTVMGLFILFYNGFKLEWIKKNMLAAEDRAPDFTLQSNNGEQITLSDFSGKSNVVLYFYPKDNTPGCTKEACAFRDNIETINAEDTVVLGISPDSIKSHEKFISKHALNFNLLSDPEHVVAEKYGAWAEKKMYGRTFHGIVRSTFIVGKDETIKKVFPKVKVDGHVDEVMEFLKTI